MLLEQMDTQLATQGTIGIKKEKKEEITTAELFDGGDGDHGYLANQCTHSITIPETNS